MLKGCLYTAVPEWLLLRDETSAMSSSPVFCLFVPKLRSSVEESLWVCIFLWFIVETFCKLSWNVWSFITLAQFTARPTEIYGLNLGGVLSRPQSFLIANNVCCDSNQHMTSGGMPLHFFTTNNMSTVSSHLQHFHRFKPHLLSNKRI